MARLVVEYDARNTVARGIVNGFIEMIKSFDFFKFHTITTSKGKDKPEKKMSGIEKSLEDVKYGRVYKAISVDDMMRGIDDALEDVKCGRVCEIADTKQYFKNLGVDV